MKQFKPAIKTIGENRFYIRPFPAFTAAKMTGDLPGGREILRQQFQWRKADP